MPSFGFYFGRYASDMSNINGLDGTGFNTSSTVTADFVHGIPANNGDFTISLAASAASGAFGINVGDDYGADPYTLYVAEGHSVEIDLVDGNMADVKILNASFGWLGGTSSDWEIQYLSSDGSVLHTLDENTNPSFLEYGNTHPEPHEAIHSLKITSITGNFTIGRIGIDYNCFAKGTQIAIPDGSKPVESLFPGDTVLTADGTVATVNWLGVQPVDTLACNPLKAYPIRITAGALGDNLPARDLELSGDHAVEIDGLLFNASTLVNGTTIYQVPDMPVEGFNYYHVELEEGHKLLLAEGVAAESYLETCEWNDFSNGDDRMARIVPEMPLMRIASARLLPQELRDRLGIADMGRFAA